MYSGSKNDSPCRREPGYRRSAKYGFFAAVFCILIIGCNSNKGDVEDAVFTTEMFLEAVIIQDMDEIIEYSNVTEDEYHRYITIGDIVKDVIEVDDIGEFGFVFKAFLEYSIQDCKIRGRNAVVSVYFEELEK